MRIPSLAAFAVPVLLAASVASSAVPDVFAARGPGGGGALFAPSFDAEGRELNVACDMSELFHSRDRGKSWELVPFHQFQANRSSEVHHSAGYRIAIDHSDPGGAGIRRIVGSVDGRAWSELPSDPTDGEAYALAIHPESRRHILTTSWSELFSSRDGGATWRSVRSAANAGTGLRLAGVFWDGADVYVGTNDGLLVSHDSGASFNLQATTGIPASQSIVSLTGGRAGGRVRLLAATVSANEVWNGMNVEEFNGSADGGLWTWSPGGSSWIAASTGIAPDARLYLVGQAAATIDTLYAAGGAAGSDWPAIYRSTNGGSSWTSILATTGNANVATGWAGAGGDRDWSYGGMACGFAVARGNGRVLAYTDYGFVHVSEDGGTTWRQSYLDSSDQNPVGAATPRGRSYRSAGLENTTAWQVFWIDSLRLFAGFSDIRGIRSTDGGTSWGFGYSGHSDNSMYRIARGSDGTLYAATSSVHDLYQSTRLADAILDAGTGRVLSSADGGATWTPLWSRTGVLAWVEPDPADAKTLYASVVHSAQGGIYVTRDLDRGSAATWTRLPAPPRTEGHPYNIVVLADGSLVTTWSGRRTSAGFTASSGVFRLPKGASVWQDLSDPGMRYWTKDIAVDPSDPTQRTWWVAVFSGWGGAPNGLGGLYRTVDAGSSWTRAWASDRVESVAFPPGSGREAYATTETEGLWHAEDRLVAAPAFRRIDAYPFRQPVRVFFNPYDTAEVWVTSFGNSLRVARRDGRSLKTSPRGGRASGANSLMLRLSREQGLRVAIVEGLDAERRFEIEVAALDGRILRRARLESDAQGRARLPLAERGILVLVLPDRSARLLAVP